MVGFIISFILLSAMLPAHVQTERLMHVDWSPTLFTLPILITSFGYHIIIPSLTTYMQHNRKMLRRTLVVGSIIPLLIYIFWEAITVGIIPLSGKVSLFSAWSSGESISMTLSRVLDAPFVRVSALFFSFFAIITSFLGVSLSLADFLSDGLRLGSKGFKGRVLSVLLTFIPPLIFLVVYKRGFVVALEYAGAFVAVLLVILPSLMVLKLKKPNQYQSPLKKALLCVIIAAGVLFIIADVMQQKGVFKPLLERYNHVSTSI
ncbi:uncharacterized protein TRIADDRAFT_62737 [Trichoplax adhaerens]|uniref:Amino acid transporter transmembrane domain-containing protein n=1 Tax=Trichoplax adhaerens TaxID=10228 RepID=B3SEQ2_TRIAD|nr:hypothetical protein TRIADDRAFT_62737 [Trichoplax adhaerens]EDV18792.1 hypothetical protein TRIADDRAFT_62737 [Trichoplax adhaerens]|eukprot:XP_002118721.1 hypothetical protein TRIADDRAFT_62737 [Trichoplax adhaerens]